MTSANKSEIETTAGNASIIGLTAFGGALIGFVLQLLVAYHFGASADTDAFFMAQSTSELLSKLLLGGSITAVFIPLFVERLARRQNDDAWHMALNILHLTAALFLVAIILLTILARPFIGFIAPGFDAATTDLTVKLLLVLLPSFLFLYLVEFATSMLHSLKQFSIPAYVRIIAPIVSIISIILLVKSFGIFALAIGIVVGSIIQVAYLFWGLKRHGLKYAFVFKPKDPIIARLLKLVYPFILSVLITQGAGITYRILVSDLSSGSLASLKFAEKITQLLAIIFLNSVTLVIYPLLSEKAALKDFAGMKDTITSAIRLISFITVPIVVGVTILRQPIISFIYQRGSFTAEDAAMTSIALLFLVIGLTINGISSILGHAVLALQETKAAVAVTIASQAIAISLFVLLVPHLDHAGLALASSLVPISSSLLYFLYLRRYLPRLHTIFKQFVFVKIGLLAGIMGTAVYFILPVINFNLPQNISLFLQIIIPAIIGAAIFFFGAAIWNIPEMKITASIAKSKIDKLPIFK